MDTSLDRVSGTRHPFAIGTIGGPTVVLDYGPLRILSDPTFDEPRDYGPYRKLTGPAVAAEELGVIDAVLLSHDLHHDNFDQAGRALAAAAPVVLTGPQAAGRLGGNATGLAPYESITLAHAGPGPVIRAHAVPAQHGPRDGDRDEFGNLNTEVTGFVLQAQGLPTVYISGDNASVEPVLQIHEHFPAIDVAVLHIGAARVAAKNAGRPLTLTADRASDVALILGATAVVPAHCDGWSIYSQTCSDVERSFHDAGITDRLRSSPLGTWALRHNPADS
jgi:L-ascorbate metabolism protein UlaG (beta-lactamase superfamily)